MELASTPWELLLEVMDRQGYARARRELETAAEPDTLPATAMMTLVKEFRREVTRLKLLTQGQTTGGR